MQICALENDTGVLGNCGSFFVIESILHAVPMGWFLPDSQASTVFTDTPRYLANNACVIHAFLRISFISFAENSSIGVTESV